MKARVKNLGFYLIGATEMIVRRSTEFIFILAMPRSGSSLLTHILNSNPEIDGIGETKMKPTSFAGLQRIVGKTRYFQRRYGISSKGNTRYILDKLVHNELLSTDDITHFQDDRFKIIFLIRNPQDTIRSLLRATNSKQTANAIQSYERRARALRHYVEQVGPEKTCLFLRFDELINCTPLVFTALERYLDLSEPLSEKYETTQATGKFTFGDNSENISKGKIVRQKEEQQVERPSIPAAQLITAQQEYEACRKAMEKYCLTVDPTSC